MQKYLRKFERLIENSVQEHLQKGIKNQGYGFDPKKFGESKSQFIQGFKEIVFPNRFR